MAVEIFVQFAIINEASEPVSSDTVITTHKKLADATYNKCQTLLVRRSASYHLPRKVGDKSQAVNPLRVVNSLFVILKRVVNLNPISSLREHWLNSLLKKYFGRQ